MFSSVFPEVKNWKRFDRVKPSTHPTAEPSRSNSLNAVAAGTNCRSGSVQPPAVPCGYRGWQRLRHLESPAVNSPVTGAVTRSSARSAPSGKLALHLASPMRIADFQRRLYGFTGFWQRKPRLTMVEVFVGAMLPRRIRFDKAFVRLPCHFSLMFMGDLRSTVERR